MAKKTQRKIPLKDIIDEEAREAEQEEMGADPVFDPDRDLGSAFTHGPTAFRRTMQDKDQLVIDELLATLPKNQGYYLKLYREILPGKFEIKERIDQYDTWTDMEWEITERVRAMTRKFGVKKWGSGLYRIVVWRNGGIRERNKYPPVDIVVDAGDDADAGANMHTGRVDPVEAANEQLNALGNMLSAVQNVMPKAVDPNVQFQAIVQAFTAGKEEKREAARQDASAMTTMMTTMMTSMMTLMTTMMQQHGKGSSETAKPFEEQLSGMMNVLKGFGFGQPQQPKTIVEQLTEMKMLGFDPTHKEDTIEQIAKLKAMTGALVDVMPSNGQVVERPGIFEKLVDALAPHVPKLFSDMKAITENAALAQQLQATRLAAMAPQPVPMDNRPRTVYGQPVGPQEDRMGVQDAFHESPDMDPYSGFHTRPFQPRTEEDAGIEMFGSVAGATNEERKAAAMGKSTVPQQNTAVSTQPTQPRSPSRPADPVVDTLAAQANGGPQQQPFDTLPPMLQQLYLLITENAVHAYGQLYDVLSANEETAGMIMSIQKKELDGEMLTDELRKTGFPILQAAGFILQSKSYLNGFVTWILEQTIGKAHALCQDCATEHIFESRYEFSKVQPICGLERSGTETCPGLLKLVTDARKDLTHVT